MDMIVARLLREYGDRIEISFDTGETERKYQSRARSGAAIARGIKAIPSSTRLHFQQPRQSLEGLHRDIGGADIVLTPDTGPLNAAAEAGKIVNHPWGNDLDRYVRWAPRGRLYLPILARSPEQQFATKPQVDNELLMKILRLAIDTVYARKVLLPNLQRRISLGRINPRKLERERRALQEYLKFIFMEGRSVVGMRAVEVIMGLQAKMFGSHDTDRRLSARDADA